LEAGSVPVGTGDNLTDAPEPPAYIPAGDRDRQGDLRRCREPCRPKPNDAQPFFYRPKEESTVTINGTRKLFEPPGRSRQTTLAPVLGPREIMFPPLGPRTALVHCSTAPFMVDLERA
jgi:hypothetical protein